MEVEINLIERQESFGLSVRCNNNNNNNNNKYQWISGLHANWITK